jgi:hypothetical protein
LYSDEFKVYPDSFKFEKSRIFKMWLNLVRNSDSMTSGEYMEAFPDYQCRIAIWNECMNGNGRPSLNAKKYWKHVDESMKKKRAKKMVIKAKKAGKMKIK